MKWFKYLSSNCSLNDLMTENQYILQHSKPQDTFISLPFLTCKCSHVLVYYGITLPKLKVVWELLFYSTLK